MYLTSSNDYLTKSNRLQPQSGHHDPAAQQRARRAAKLPEQSGLGTADVRRIAAEPLVMVSCDQQSLVRQRPRNHPREKLETVAQPGIGVGRAGVAEDSGARTAADRDALDDLRGFVDPAWVQHGAGMQEHQPRRAGLPRAGRQCRRMRSLKRQVAAPPDIGDAFDNAGAAPVDQQPLTP